jgi:hypothetical protein
MVPNNPDAAPWINLVNTYNQNASQGWDCGGYIC